ncbi:caspase family protein [Parachitinimonas caeni]|uniref:Caspase family protein n=1 Tax=Parachitinimonas caeni TaxID=3031301 RepID=A0ABT7DS63_9NEIS|nr:caspase family protein [Parachitinimonas caeni]MDK2122804.1 caspase family protein [Parachitinimonas caeni]
MKKLVIYHSLLAGLLLLGGGMVSAAEQRNLSVSTKKTRPSEPAPAPSAISSKAAPEVSVTITPIPFPREGAPLLPANVVILPPSKNVTSASGAPLVAAIQTVPGQVTTTPAHASTPVSAPASAPTLAPTQTQPSAPVSAQPVIAAAKQTPPPAMPAPVAAHPAPVVTTAVPQVPASFPVATTVASPQPAPSPMVAATSVSTAPAIVREQKLALVIGNGAYRDSPLLNPVNDARAMASKLQQLGFSVTKRENIGLEEIQKVVRDFGNQLKNGGVGLFFYAGHGLQVKGNNYLVPVGADIQAEDEVSTRAYNVNEVLEKLDSAKNRVNVVILDACRNNPFARSFRSNGSGLAQMDAPTGTLVAFATAPGRVASDGSGGNGLYTENLLRAMSQPGLRIEEVFKQVRVGVMQQSGGQQTPWENTSLTGDFYFNPLAGQENTAAPIQLAMAQSAELAPSRSIGVILPRKLFESYQLISGLGGFTGDVLSARFSSDGRRLALFGADRAARVWDAQSGAVINQTASAGQRSLSPDGKYLLTPAESNSLRVLDTESGGMVAHLKGHRERVVEALYSPDGKRIVARGGEGDIYLWDIEAGKLLDTLSAPSGKVTFLFSPNGKRLLAWGDEDSNLRMWNVADGKRESAMRAHWKKVNSIRFSPDGSRIVTASDDESAKVWNGESGDELFSLKGHVGPVVDGLFSADARRVLTRGANGQVILWDGTNGRQLQVFEGVQQSMFFSPEGSKIILNGMDRVLRQADAQSGALLATIPGNVFVSFSADGRRYATLGDEGARLWDTQSGAAVARLPGQVAVFFAGKGRLLASAGNDFSLQLWDAEHGDPVGVLKGHVERIRNVVFSADGRRLLSWGDDKSLRLWGLPEVNDIATLSKDAFETTLEYQTRVGKWSSAYSAIVNLGEYDADVQVFNVRLGDHTFGVPMPREEARKLAGQKQVQLTGTLRFSDAERLELAGAKLSRLP